MLRAAGRSDVGVVGFSLPAPADRATGDYKERVITEDIPRTIVKVIAVFEPPRRLSIRSGATIPGYSIRRLGRPIVEATFKRDSIAAFDERVFITQHPVAVMPYGDFLHVIDGVFEGLYIPRNLVVANVLTESRSNAV